MNKQLVSVAAVAAMAAGGALAVESQNIVGFIDKTAEFDVYTPVTVPMASVGYTSIAISDIKFEGIARDDSLQIFGNNGDVATELFKSPSGWEDQDGEDASDWVFQPGDSFWIYPSNGDDDLKATFPGEVSDEPLYTTAEFDVYTPFGNGTAGAVAIEDIVFEGIARDDSLQIFGNNGDVETELFKSPSGWEDQDGEDASDWVFQPGDSFWIYPSNGDDDLTVTIPAAI